MKCFYHSADLDGHCSGALIKNVHPKCKMYPINYGQEFPWDDIENHETIFIVDFCLQPFEQMHKLNDICNIVWIDHHKSSIERAHNEGFLASCAQYLAIGKAGCELTYEYVHGLMQKPQKSVYLLGRYDVWDHVPGALEFQYGMRLEEDTSPNNQKLWNSLFINDITTNKIIKRGKELLKYERLQNKKFCDAYSYEIEFEGLYCVIANKGFSNSQTFDSIYNTNIHDAMILYSFLPKIGKWTVSIYSNVDDIDCSKIAIKYGGGGHKGAAGFQCDELPKEFLLK